MFNIYVANQKIDTLDTKGVVLNANIYDINNPSNIGLTFSNKIHLPKTANNVDIFGIYDEDIFYQTFEADVYDKTVHVIRGYIKVIEIGEYISIQITGIFKQLSENLKKPMYELDISSDDFIYNMTNYNLLKAATTGSWSWELADNRFLPSIMPLKATDYDDPNLAAFKPHYNVLELVTQIFKEEGLTVDISEVNSKLTNLRMLSNPKDFWIAFYQCTITSGTITASNPIPLSTTVYDFWWNASTMVNDFASLSTTNIFFTFPVSHLNYNVNNLKYILEIDINEAATLQVIRNYYSPFETKVVEEHFINKIGTVFTQEFDSDKTNQQTGVWFRFNINVTINRIRVIALASEKAMYLGNTIYSFKDGTSILNWQRYTLIPVWFYSLLEGLYVKTQYNLPDWTQLKFLKEVFKLMNISMQFEGTEVKLTHNVLNDFIDITNKIIKITPQKNNDIYAIKNYFKYLNDIGNYNLRLNSKTLEKTFIKSDTEGSDDYYITELTTNFYLGKVRLYNLTFPNNTNEDDRIEVENRFFLSNINDVSGIINASKKLLFDGLSFVDLYDDFYSSIYDYLQNSRIIVYEVKIDYNQFLAIIDKKKIYNSVLGRELTVIKISKFNPQTTTQLTAITREV